MLTLSAALAVAVSAEAWAQPLRVESDPEFDILEFDVEGNSVLSVREIERAVTPFLGEHRHFRDVEGARRALEDLYQKGGYQTVFVDVPEQRVVGGHIRLHVAQGTVGQLRVTGSRYFALGEIRSKVEQFAPGSVPDFPAMQQELGQVNRNPDLQVTPILTPGRVPGTVDVELSVKDHPPVHADISLDNHASPFTSALRANADIHYDNLWQRQHSLALNFQTAPEKPSESRVAYGTYLWRFSQAPDVLSLYAIHTSSHVAVVGSSTILGNANIAGLRWIRPLGTGALGSGTFFHSFNAGLDRKDFGQTNIAAITDVATVLPPITYVPVSVGYAAVLSAPTSTLQTSAGLSTAPRGVLGNSDSAFQGRRVAGGASYLAWKFDLALDAYPGRSWCIHGRLAGQWTADALIPNEQFSAGGSDSVRGYRESEVLGDVGLQSNLEGRWYPWGRDESASSGSRYAEVFVDWAEVRLVDPLGPQIGSANIASAGFGFHAQSWHRVTFAVDAARALHDGGLGTSGYITRKGGRRVEFSIGYGF